MRREREKQARADRIAARTARLAGAPTPTVTIARVAEASKPVKRRSYENSVGEADGRLRKRAARDVVCDREGEDDAIELETIKMTDEEAEAQAQNADSVVSALLSLSHVDRRASEGDRSSVGDASGGNSLFLTQPSSVDTVLLTKAAVMAAALTTQYGAVDLAEIIFMSLIGAAREPPLQVTRAVRAADAKYNFGARLRNSTQPDFISRAVLGESESGNISRKVIETSADWLIPSIGVDVGTVLARIPPVAVIHVYLITFSKIFARFKKQNFWLSSAEVHGKGEGESRLVRPVSLSFSYLKNSNSLLILFPYFTWASFCSE